MLGAVKTERCHYLSLCKFEKDVTDCGWYRSPRTSPSDPGDCKRCHGEWAPRPAPSVRQLWQKCHGDDPGSMARSLQSGSIGNRRRCHGQGRELLRDQPSANLQSSVQARSSIAPSPFSPLGILLCLRWLTSRAIVLQLVLWLWNDGRHVRLSSLPGVAHSCDLKGWSGVQGCAHRGSGLGSALHGVPASGHGGVQDIPSVSRKMKGACGLKSGGGPVLVQKLYQLREACGMFRPL